MATTCRARGSGAQTFDCPKLKLLDCSLRLAEFLRNVSNTFLFHESFEDDGALVFRKAVDELKQCCAAFNVGPTRMIEIIFGNRLRAPLRCLAPSIGDRVGCNSEKPDGERHTTPFELR